jgi:ribonucleoside-diphosphate reductase alpha chain
MTEYIEKAKNIRGFEAAVNFAKKSRAIGIGVLGWHTFLQENKIPFDSFQAMMYNSEIFKKMREDADKATADLAKEYGEPLWCEGLGRRNTHCIAVAPTVSNSIISGSVSAGIEPIAANVFALKTAKGTFMRKNSTLEKLLEEKGKNTPEIWKSISQNDGSVQGLSFLTAEEKEIFLTAREISQFAIIKQAAQRQKYIDQGQSVNLFFGKNSDPRYIHQVHMEAWKQNLKGLYYCRAESMLKGDMVNRQKEECKACEG